MNLIQATIKAALPAKRKMTPSGWESFNASCCHNNGEKRDTRGRGGIIFKGDGWTYHCFNCHFKAGWTPGHLLSKNSRNLMLWMGIPEATIQKLALEAIKNKDEMAPPPTQFSMDLDTKSLPENCKTFNDWADEGCESPDFLSVVEYVISRGFKLEWFNWMWSDENGYRDRVIIPYFHDGRIVGWTGRKITDGNPRYLTSAQPSYVFNLDHQTDDRQYVLVVEGPLDAISIDGVGVMSNELNESQISRINALGKEVIVVPDNDKPGTKLIDTAIDQGWSASLPDWGDDVKDTAKAVEKYGRVYTLYTILKYRERGEIRLTMLKKRILNAASED